MPEFTEEELREAREALLSTLRKCEKIDLKKLGQSQRTLLTRRMAALRLALELISAQEGEGKE